MEKNGTVPGCDGEGGNVFVFMETASLENGSKKRSPRVMKRHSRRFPRRPIAERGLYRMENLYPDRMSHQHVRGSSIFFILFSYSWYKQLLKGEGRRTNTGNVLEGCKI